MNEKSSVRLIAIQDPDTHSAPADVGAFAIRGLPKIHTASFDRPAGVPRYRVAVALNVEPRAERNNPRIDCDNAVSRAHPCGARAGAAALVRRIPGGRHHNRAEASIRRPT